MMCIKLKANRRRANNNTDSRDSIGDTDNRHQPGYCGFGACTCQT